jgi:CopG family nickel-responsive transcriptional regulator
MATMHIHLDEDNCLEVLAVRGPGPSVQRLADRLCSLKGVKHGKLTATSTGRHLK